MKRFIPALIVLFPSLLFATVEHPEVIIPDVVPPTPPQVSVMPPPKPQAPAVTVCHLVSTDYVISDSDGFGMCKARGGQAVAGSENQRELKNIKDADKM